MEKNNDMELYSKTLKKALKETFDAELEDNDIIDIEHNYQDHMVVDIIVNKQFTFYAFNFRFGSFPY